jgi:hypothetical protein
MRRSHRAIATGASQDSLEQGTKFVSCIDTASPTVSSKQGLDPLPHIGRDDRVVFTFVDFVFVG